jgi:hypothetical protein
MRVTGHLPPSGRRGRAAYGRWRVTEAESADALERQRRWSPDAAGHPLPAGEYTVLVVDGAFSMCDAPFMLRNYVPFVAAAEGDILLTGLGLGCLVRGLLARPAVRTITVLELHADVIDLVAAHHTSSRVEVIHTDALTWTPPAGRRWDSAMLDIADDRGLARRLIDHHAPHVHALWPNPDDLSDEPLGPDLAAMVAAATRAIA